MGMKLQLGIRFLAFWGIYGFISGILLWILEERFLECPYPDFLSWDGNLRFISSLRMMDALRSWNIFSFLFQLLDSPTWPILRNLFQILSFFIFGFNGTVDTNLTVFTYVLVIGCFPYLYLLQSKRKISAPFLFSSFISLLLLFYSETILLYVFSPMLEIQGSLFTLLFLFSFHNFLKNKNNIFYPAFYGFLSYQTKYPYGYIIIFFILIFFALTSWKECFKYIKDFCTTLFSKTYIFFTFLTIVFFLISFFFSKALPGKLSFYLLYLSIVIFSCISSIFILNVNKVHSTKLSISLQFIVLPIVIFTILHPDRVGSSSGTISHIQAEGKFVGELLEKDLNYYLSFFITLYNDIWNNSKIGLFFFAIQLLSLFSGLILLIKNKVKIYLYPSFIYSFFIFISILGLTFLTPNHQARHVFHLYPSLILGSFLYLSEKSFFQKKINYSLAYIQSLLFSFHYKNNSIYNIKKIYLNNNSFYFLGIILLISLSISWLNILIRYEFSSVHLCFGGKIPIYDLPIFYEKELENKLHKNTLLINQIDPSHLNKVDTELVFVKSAYNQKIKLALNTKEYNKNPYFFEQVVIAGSNCSYSLENLESLLNSKIIVTSEIRTDKACLVFMEKVSQ
jgi:hypothetical protein